MESYLLGIYVVQATYARYAVTFLCVLTAGSAISHSVTPESTGHRRLISQSRGLRYHSCRASVSVAVTAGAIEVNNVLSVTYLRLYEYSLRLGDIRRPTSHN